LSSKDPSLIGSGVLLLYLYDTRESNAELSF
jgi:hypothetical protein